MMCRLRTDEFLAKHLDGRAERLYRPKGSTAVIVTEEFLTSKEE